MLADGPGHYQKSCSNQELSLFPHDYLYMYHFGCSVMLVMVLVILLPGQYQSSGLNQKLLLAPHYYQFDSLDVVEVVFVENWLPCSYQSSGLSQKLHLVHHNSIFTVLQCLLKSC